MTVVHTYFYIVFLHIHADNSSVQAEYHVATLANKTMVPDNQAIALRILEEEKLSPIPTVQNSSGDHSAFNWVPLALFLRGKNIGEWSELAPLPNAGLVNEGRSTSTHHTHTFTHTCLQVVYRNTLSLHRSHLAYRGRLQSSLVVTPRNVQTAIAYIAKGEAAIPIDILILLKYFAQSFRQSLPTAARVWGCKERPATQRQNDDVTSSVKFQMYAIYEHLTTHNWNKAWPADAAIRKHPWTEHMRRVGSVLGSYS